jgi:hypothetical protein
VGIVDNSRKIPLAPIKPECPRSDEEEETRETSGQKRKTALKGK